MHAASGCQFVHPTSFSKTEHHKVTLQTQKTRNSCWNDNPEKIVSFLPLHGQMLANIHS
jgi:hypothetical protein